MKKLTVAIISTLLLLSMSYSFAKDFSDVDTSHWAKQYIDALSNSGVISGYEDGTYRPQNSVTRAEFLKLLICSDPFLENQALEYGKTIEQVNWYDPYVKYTMFLKASSYKYEEEEYQMPIERVEIATFICNFRRMYDLTIANEVGERTEFSDISGLTNIESISIIEAEDYGIMNGYEDGTFKPNNPVTRAEVSAIIFRWINLLRDNDVVE